MKKVFNYLVMMVMAMTLCVGFSSCNDDEKGDDTEQSGNNGNGGNGSNNGNDGNNGNDETIDLQPSGNIKITESTGKEFVVGYNFGSVKSHYNYADLNNSLWTYILLDSGFGNCILFSPSSSSNYSFSDGGYLEGFLLREGATIAPGSNAHRFRFYLRCQKLEKGEMLTIDGRGERFIGDWVRSVSIGFGVAYGDTYGEFDYGEGVNNSDNYYGESHAGNPNYTGTIEIIDINKATYEWRNDWALKWQKPGNITIKFSNVQIRNIYNHILTIDGTIKLPYIINEGN